MEEEKKIEEKKIPRISCDRFRALLSIPPNLSEEVNKLKDEHMKDCLYCQEFVHDKKYAHIRGN